MLCHLFLNIQFAYKQDGIKKTKAQKYQIWDKKIKSFWPYFLLFFMAQK